MSKKEEFEDDKVLNAFEEALALPKKSGDKLAPQVAAKEKPKPPMLITFDRYFTALGRPMHHKSGMAAFANTKGKKTQESWDALFLDY